MKQTAGQSRKSHKSRKTAAKPQSAGSPSSTALATVAPLPTSVPITASLVEEVVAATNPLAGILDAPPQGDEKQEAVTTGVPSVNPKDQWWYRPPDSKARKVVEKIVVMREAGHSDKEIAKRLKSTEGSVRQYVYMARKNGWLTDDDEMVDVEFEAAMELDRKVVRNVSASLDGSMTNWQTHEMTIAAAKGRGIFKTDKGEAAGPQQLPIVAIQIVMPVLGEGDQLPEIGEDQMGGVPAYVEGEVVASVLVKEP